MQPPPAAPPGSDEAPPKKGGSGACGGKCAGRDCHFYNETQVPCSVMEHTCPGVCTECCAPDPPPCLPSPPSLPPGSDSPGRNLRLCIDQSECSSGQECCGFQCKSPKDCDDPCQPRSPPSPSLPPAAPGMDESGGGSCGRSKCDSEYTCDDLLENEVPCSVVEHVCPGVCTECCLADATPCIEPPERGSDDDDFRRPGRLCLNAFECTESEHECCGFLCKYEEDCKASVHFCPHPPPSLPPPQKPRIPDMLRDIIQGGPRGGSNNNSGKGLSGGAIAGIVAGAVLFLSCILLVVWRERHRRLKAEAAAHRAGVSLTNRLSRSKASAESPALLTTTRTAAASTTVTSTSTEAKGLGATDIEQAEPAAAGPDGWSKCSASSLGSAPFGDGVEEQLEDFERIRLLGRGTSGHAILLRSRRSGRLAVVKEVAVDAKMSSSLENEVRILASMSHPSIVKYYGAFKRDNTLAILMEFADHGSLAEAISIQTSLDKPFEAECVVRWCTQLASALDHLHSKRVLHRDLKTANVFLSSSEDDSNVVNAKLGDFGISRALSTNTDLAETVCGTPFYMSPELVMGKPYAEPADVWSLGVVLYELLTLRRPFNAANIGTLVLSITSGSYNKEALEASTHSSQLKSLASKDGMLNPDPDARIAIPQIITKLSDMQLANETRDSRAAGTKTPKTRNSGPSGYAPLPAAQADAGESRVDTAPDDEHV